MTIVKGDALAGLTVHVKAQERAIQQRKLQKELTVARLTNKKQAIRSLFM